MELVGRDRELERIRAFLDSPRDGTRALVIEGEAGIGKTTVWRAGIEAAHERGYRVVRAAPAEVESEISFGAIIDLLGELADEIVVQLPASQRRALEVALLLAEPEGPIRREAVGGAVLSVLRLLSAPDGLLLAIDDLQWLDAASATALLHAVARLRSEQIRILLATRELETRSVASARDWELGSAEYVRLGPLTVAATQRLIRSQLEIALPRPLVKRLNAAAGGNPFYAIELARALSLSGPITAADPLPLPVSLTLLIEDRLAALAGATRRALLVAASLPSPTVGIVAAVLGQEPDLQPAVDAGVVDVVSGRIVFSHPLLGSTLAAQADPAELRDVHRELAGVVDDPDQRARHLARAAAGPDAAAARALEDAAIRTRARGAPEAAAELIERAVELTEDANARDRTRRLLTAAEVQRDAGDWGRSRELARAAVELAAPGSERAGALLGLAMAIPGDVDVCEAALREARDEPGLRARIGLALAEATLLHDVSSARAVARRADDDARRSGERALRVETLSLLGWLEGATGEGDALATVRQAVELEQGGALPWSALGNTPEFALATLHMWRDEHEPAREGFGELLVRAVERGDAFGEAHARLHLAQVEWRAGNWDEADHHAREADTAWRDSGDEQGAGAILWVNAVIRAHRGDLVAARALASRSAEATLDDQLYRARNDWALGFAALSEGDAAAAEAQLETAAQGFEQLGITEPGMRLHAADLLEARVALGHLEQADAEAAALERLGATLGRPRARVAGARGRGLVAAARGELDIAVDALQESVALAELLHVPFELGRSLLALGVTQRRARQRRAARESLTASHAIFDRLGATLWAKRARAELERAAGERVAPYSGELTRAERRVAALVAEGSTNREVATELGLSVHTVEAALRSVYRKLDVRSRTELARKLTGSD